MIRAELLTDLPPVSREYLEKRKKEREPSVRAMTGRKVRKTKTRPSCSFCSAVLLDGQCPNKCGAPPTTPKKRGSNKGCKIDREPKYPWKTLEVGQMFFVPHKTIKYFNPTRRHADKRYGITTKAVSGRFRGCPGVLVRRVA